MQVVTLHLDLLMMLLLILLCTMSATIISLQEVEVPGPEVAFLHGGILEEVEVASPEVAVLHGGILDLMSDTGDCDLKMSPNKYPIK